MFSPKDCIIRSNLMSDARQVEREETKNDLNQFSDIEKAGMAYFMPKLLKSASCPSYVQENPMSSARRN